MPLLHSSCLINVLIAELISEGESIDWVVSRVARKHIAGTGDPERTDPSTLSMCRGCTACRITGLGLFSPGGIYG